MKLFALITIIVLVGCQPKSQVYNYEGENLKVAGNDSTHHTIENIVMPFRVDMEAQMDITIGNAAKTFENSRTKAETNIGNWMADILFKTGFNYLEQNNISASPHFCFSLLNKGGIRAPLNAGNITIGNIFEIMPFDNEIVIVKLAASTVKQIINYLFSVNGQPVSNAVFYLSSNSGKVEIGNQYYDYNGPVYVITSDYLAKGGDKMDFFTNAKEYWQTGILIRDALLNEVKDKKEVKAPGNFGRILFTKENE